MNKFVVVVDIDDTINNLLEVWVSWLNREYHTNVVAKDIREWDLSKTFVTLTKQQIYSPLHNVLFWREIQAKPGAVEALQDFINRGMEVYLCTATHYATIVNKFTEFIQRLFPFIGWKHIIIAYDKSMILGDVMIDDKLDNILHSRCPTRILFSAPHNEDFVTDGRLTYRARTWADVAEIVNDVYIWSKEK
jgi:5'(3')-deoxyribonucleotidase